MVGVETSGPSVDDAIDAALEQLDLDEDQVEIEVLDEGGSDRPARIRATPRRSLDEEDDEGTDTSAKPATDGAWDDELATAGRETLEDLLDYMGFPGEVDVLRAGLEADTPTLTMAVVDGESMGALIGRRGETLQSLQFICQLLVNRRVGHWTRVLLDVEGYRSRRERYLKDTALRAAEKAMRYREAIELDPMIPSERRIVHLALAEHDYVTTHSEGEGDSRRVIVEPKPEFIAERGGPSEGSGRRPFTQSSGFGRGPRSRPRWSGGGYGRR